MQTFLLEPSEAVLGDIEEWCRNQGFRYVIGVDEAGRGPLAGPVYAAAVVLDLHATDTDWLDGIDDSKKLSPDQRDVAIDIIRERSIACSVASQDHTVVDDINILQATLRAMEQAIDDVCLKLDERPDRVFIDGNTPVETSLPQQPIVGGDGRSFHIAAASILAKVERDRVMVEHHQRWPEYNFASNKGYGTAEHRRAIAEFGPCAVHRLTFGGVREHVERLRTT